MKYFLLTFMVCLTPLLSGYKSNTYTDVTNTSDKEFSFMVGTALSLCSEKIISLMQFKIRKY